MGGSEGGVTSSPVAAPPYILVAQVGRSLCFRLRLPRKRCGSAVCCTGSADKTESAARQQMYKATITASRAALSA
jgi:hypothetical protein